MGDGEAAGRDSGESVSIGAQGTMAGCDRENASAVAEHEKQEKEMRETIGSLEEENRQLREALAQVKMAPARDQNFDGQVTAPVSSVPSKTSEQDETSSHQIIYSTSQMEHAKTIGPTLLQGV